MDRPEWVRSARNFSRGNDDSRCVLKADAPVDTDEIGITTMYRTWQCRTDRVETFLPKRFDRDFVHPTLLVDQWRVRHREAWRSEIEIKYVGILRPEELTPRPEFNRREITETFTEGDRSVTVRYFSPMVTTDFAAVSRPSDEAAPKIDPGGIVRLRSAIVNGQDLLEAGQIGISLGRIMFTFGLEQARVRTEFPRKREGLVYRCREVVQTMLQKRGARVLLT